MKCIAIVQGCQVYANKRRDEDRQGLAMTPWLASHGEGQGLVLTDENLCDQHSYT